MIAEPIVPRKPNIIYKPDTVQYVIGNYKVSADSLITALLVKMEGMEVGKDKSIWFQGKQVDKVKINGKYWRGLSVLKAATTVLVGMVEDIQMIDDYGDAPSIHLDMEPQEVLNINIKKNAVAYIGSLLTLGQRKPASSLSELLKKLQSLDIDTTGILMYKGNPVNRVKLLDTTVTPKVTTVRLCCAEYIYTSIIEQMAEQIAANMNGNTDPNTDDYGDQIPHFLIQPKPGSYTSKATRY